MLVAGRLLVHCYTNSHRRLANADRDFTINALFYNLKTKMLEDFTGKAFADLEQGLSTYGLVTVDDLNPIVQESLELQFLRAKPFLTIL